MTPLNQLNERLLIAQGLAPVSARTIMERIEELENENAMLRQNMTLHRYSHDEIEAACGVETSLAVREKVMQRREDIAAERAAPRQPR